MRRTYPWIVGVALYASIGCEKKTDDATRDPVRKPAVAASASAATGTSPTAAASAPFVVPASIAGIRCVDGSLSEPSDGGGTGLGVGLGSHGPEEHLRGTFTRFEGKLDPHAAATALCAAPFSSCFGSDVSLLVSLTIVVGEDGGIESATITNGLPETALGACLTDAARKLALPKPTDGKATLEYTLDYRRIYTAKSKGSAVKMIESGVDVTGRLPHDLIRRIVRANFPRFRACYAQGLKKDPALAGVVSVKFIIDSTGAVESVSLLPGSLPDPAVKSCVSGVFRTLSFPEPEGGKVTVTYPIDFSTEEQ